MRLLSGLMSFSAFAPTNLQYNSGPSVSTPQVAVAVIFLLSAKLKYGGVKISAFATRAVRARAQNRAHHPLTINISALLNHAKHRKEITKAAYFISTSANYSQCSGAGSLPNNFLLIDFFAN